MEGQVRHELKVKVVNILEALARLKSEYASDEVIPHSKGDQNLFKIRFSARVCNAGWRMSPPV